MQRGRQVVAATGSVVRRRLASRGQAGLMMILVTVLILGISAAIVLHALNSGGGCEGERGEILAAYRLSRESGGLSHGST